MSHTRKHTWVVLENIFGKTYRLLSPAQRQAIARRRRTSVFAALNLLVGQVATLTPAQYQRLPRFTKDNLKKARLICEDWADTEQRWNETRRAA